MAFAIKRRKKLVYISIAFLSIFIIVTIDLRHIYRNHYYDDDDDGRPITPGPLHFQYRLRKAVVSHDGEAINHVFSYPINIEDACTKKDVKIIFPVHSAVTNIRRRTVTRKSKQGQFAKNESNRVRLLFFVGLPSKNVTGGLDFQAKLKNESATYGDIIQINVTDTYHHIVYKSIAVLQWISNYCANSEFVIKMDDDVNVDPPLLLWSLYSKKRDYNNFILGELRLNRKPERSEEKKWHIKEAEWPNTTFPPFVPGPAVGYPTSTVLLLHKQAKKTRPIWLDDVFITGICSQKLGIPVLNDTNFYNVHKNMRAPHFVYDD